MNDSIPTLPPLFPPAEIDGVTARELMANMLRIAALPPEEKAKMCAEIKKDIPYCSVEIDEMGVVNIWDCRLHTTQNKNQTKGKA